jgi:hypothetical protein
MTTMPTNPTRASIKMNIGVKKDSIEISFPLSDIAVSVVLSEKAKETCE